MKTNIFLIIIGLLLINLSCKDSSSLSDNIESLESKITIDSSIVNNPKLFYFEFKILNMNSQKSVDSINNELKNLKGLVGFETKLQPSTCIVYADSLNTYKKVINAINSIGYKIDEQINLGGPGLTCEIPPEGNVTVEENILIESLEQSVLPFKTIFNENQNRVRVISIPNPSCLSCVKGQRYIYELFSKQFPNNPDIIGLTAWISIDGWGKLEDAERLAPEIKDSRIYNFWDSNMLLGKLFKKPLNLNKEYKTAWDVYLIYESGITWEGSNPPKPTYWMHKLGGNESGAEKSLFLDEEEFFKKLKNIIPKQ